ncbi:hypothetical protein TSAR_011102 [Trichomalopsis sarcophagae]|uniref:Uncharacterized protein n=1 Tax=Trichomalopsis sarcophagae TaxID=543379 RepID=A0A232EQY8_9HYME|nr:hypothetical protein TSAR_011102 [Trichomalopsis sarcophagae]
MDDELSEATMTVREFVLCLGLWIYILVPLQQSLQELKDGVDINVKGIVLYCTADLPVKSLFLNMNQYNGRFGCLIFLLGGLTVDRTRTYPFCEHLILRYEKDTIKYASQALEIGQPVRKLAELWFDSNWSSENFSPSNLVEVVDSRLCSIEPPSFVARRLRSIESHFKYWKASEQKIGLRHLAEVVRRLCPLWTTSCFALEDLNGKMKALVHSSRKPELQIIFNFNIYSRVHILKQEWLRENSDV